MELVAEADAMDDTIAAGVGDGMGDGMGDGIVVIVAAGRGDGCAFNPDVDCAEDEAGSSFVSVFCDVVGWMSGQFLCVCAPDGTSHESAVDGVDLNVRVL